MTATPLKRRILDLIRVIWEGYRTSSGYKGDKEDKKFEKTIFGEPDDYTIPQLANIFTLLARKAGYREKEITSLWKTGKTDASQPFAHLPWLGASQSSAPIGSHWANPEWYVRRVLKNPVRQGSWDQGAKPFTSTRKGTRMPLNEMLQSPGSLYVPLSHLSEELERLRKNRDEMLEDFSIRNRPNHPFDFVVIVKHRSYIEGRRLYSAALKTKGRIEDSIWPFGGRIIGWRQKEKGGSDYTYEIYGIRYAKDRPNFQGKKLFDNAEKMKLQIGGAFGWEDVSEEIEGTQKRRTSIYSSKKEAMKDAREFKKMGYAVRVLRANSYRMPTTAAQERADKIAKMRREGLEPLPYGLEKATLRQLQMLGHGDSIWSKKWGMRVKRVR